MHLKNVLKSCALNLYDTYPSSYLRRKAGGIPYTAHGAQYSPPLIFDFLLGFYAYFRLVYVR